MNSIPIDWANVNWVYVGVLAVFVFVATLIGNLFALNHRGFGAFLSALLFAAIFVFWSYYPHGLPLPTSLAQKPAITMPAAAPVPPAPVKPANPVTDITPPKNPVTDVTPPAR
jgi:hypothetical protein